jgi:serpin B
LNDFSFELFKKISQGHDESTAFSPYSLYVALSMVLAIAKGEARTEIFRAYNLDPAIDSEAFVAQLKQLISQIEKVAVGDSGMVNGVNSIWTERNLASRLPPNAFDVLSPLDAAVNLTSFPQPGVDDINNYVKEKTHNLIPKLLSPSTCPQGTFYVLVNCLYFIDRWMDEFKKSSTSTQQFFGWNKTIQCQLMSQKRRYLYFEDSNFQLVQIPYKTTDCSMFVVLPTNKNDKDFLRNFTPDYLFSREYSSQQVMLFLPKFTVRSKWEHLKEGLVQCGIQKIWREPSLPGDAVLSEAIQEAVVIVDEEKTEAAAATAMVMKLLSCRPSTPKVFRADHPFAFFIVNNTSRTILFMGVITEPKE